jgi:hypothetical protein
MERIIILLIVLIMVLVILVILILVVLIHIIHILVCPKHRRFVLRKLLSLMLMLLFALTIIGDGTCHYSFCHLDIDAATGFYRRYPWLAICRPVNV